MNFHWGRPKVPCEFRAYHPGHFVDAKPHLVNHLDITLWYGVSFRHSWFFGLKFFKPHKEKK